MGDKPNAPWRAGHCDTTSGVTIFDDNGEVVAQVPHPVHSAHGTKARARLIAAAPDLLAAMPSLPHPGGRLVKVVAHYEKGMTQTIDGDVVASAIAKAKGTPCSS